MGDYTQGYVRIRGGVGADRAAEVLEVLTDAGYGWDDREQYDTKPDGSGRWVRTREDSEIDWSAADFTGEQITGDASSEVVSRISDLCPDARAWAQTDPAYEWLGVVAMWTPELGYYQAEGDANGEPQFTAHQVLEWVRASAKAGQSGEELLAFLETRMGIPWVRSIFPESAPEEAARV